MSGNRWLPEEIELLERVWPVMGSKCERLFPRHSRYSILKRVERHGLEVMRIDALIREGLKASPDGLTMAEMVAQFGRSLSRIKVVVLQMRRSGEIKPRDAEKARASVTRTKFVLGDGVPVEIPTQAKRRQPAPRPGDGLQPVNLVAKAVQRRSPLEMAWMGAA